MIRDPIPLLKAILGARLKSESKSDRVEIDGIVGGQVPWRPHLLEARRLRGWYIHAAPPSSNSWAERILRATKVASKLKVGVAGTEEFLANEDLLQKCHELNASVLLYKQKGDSFVAEKLFQTVEDYIYSSRLKLTAPTARKILDIALDRAIQEKDKHRKGVLLELLVAVVLSQVDGFEVTDVGISNRSQQMDIMIHNRNVGGALGNSPIVIAEAKNWKVPVDVSEYAVFVRKLQSRHGRAKLGYLVTTSRFTAGVVRNEGVNRLMKLLLC